MSEALKAFGTSVRELRNNLGLTQEALGELCQRHPVYISELERGIKNPSLDSIYRLSKALQVTPGDLMNLAFSPDEKDRAVKKQIMTLVSQQEGEVLKKLLAIVRAFLEVK